MDKNQGYSILKAVMLENGRGFALGHHPTAPRTASGSMNGDITATIWPLWNRIFQTG